jgi:crotonobetainyl-CoA:carnitine CoA-transferase CaiB-like acyl-CoA transferase
LIGDQGSGLAAAFAILAAVVCARRTGQGEHIDVSMADLLASWVAPMGNIAETPVSPGHRARGHPGMGAYATADGGWVVLGIFSEDHFWDALCRQVGLKGYVGLGMAERNARGEELTEALQALFASRSRDELIAELDPLGVPIAPVLSRAEALEHPHFWARGVMARGPEGDRRVGHPIRYREHPAREPGLPPAVGEGGDVGFASGD